MRIGIDFLSAQHGSTQGYDSCTRNLLESLDNYCRGHEFVVFSNTPFYIENKKKFSNLQLVECKGNWTKSRMFRAAWQSTLLPGLIHKYRIDGIYFPTHFRPVQDLGSVWSVFNLHDIQYRFIPSNFGNLRILVRNFYYKLSLTKCERSICISNYVKHTVMEQFPSTPVNHLVVIPDPVAFDNGSNDSPSNDKLALAYRPYILTIGKHFPHKNFETLIRAFALVIQKNKYPGSLIIGGTFTGHTPYLKKLASDLDIADRVLFLGYVSNSLRESLYRSADLFVFPSLYEGFGMPPIEAMGRKIPVVCSDTTALPEVTLSLVAYYSPAKDTEALAQAIITTLERPPSQEQLQEISKQVRYLYNPETISKQYIDLWESLGR